MDVARLFDGMRLELRERILPELGDDYDRAVVIAMLGILGDLALEVVPDEAWCRTTAAELRPAIDRWSEALGGAARVEELARRADAAPPAAARRALLEAASTIVRAIWHDERLRRDGALLAEIRRALRADLGRQLARIR